LSILVRNLPKTFTKENLEDLFFEFGTIASCDLVMDEASGLSKGFGFVEKETDKAIEKLNAKTIDGKKIRVKWSNQEKKQAEAIASAPAPKRDIPEDVWGSASRNSSERENDAE